MPSARIPLPAVFEPPAESTIPNDEFGSLVKLGRDIIENPARYAKPYVGNSLSCAHCHLELGRKPDTAPLWAAYVSYPAYRTKSHSVMTYDQRLQDCFLYSMNGKRPPLGSTVLIALDAYSYWLASGAVVDSHLPGRGYPSLPAMTAPPNVNAGKSIYTARCAACHQADGSGTKAGGRVVFLAVWGADSYNWGAGMANISNAASFIKLSMPLTQPNSLSVEELMMSLPTSTARNARKIRASQDRSQKLVPSFTQRSIRGMGCGSTAGCWGRRDDGSSDGSSR